MQLVVLALLLLALPLKAQTVVDSGRWTTADYEVAGKWHIVETDARLYVVLGDDFETKNGPDLHILLSPRPFGELDDASAANGALVVGPLTTSDDATLFKKMKGAQRLALPAGIRLGDYRSIAIHCVRFSHLWAGADLATR